MSSGDLEKSLRAEIESYIGGRLSGLKEEVEQLRAQLDDALSRLRERMDEPSTESDAPLAVAISDHLRHARDLGIETASAESARTRAASDIALIKAAVDELDGRQTQAEVLGALVNRAAAFAPRLAFFVVKNERATGWRARGLAGTVGDDSVRELSLPVSSDTILGEVVRTRSTWSGEPGTHAEDHTIYNHFGGEPPQRLVAVPMVARDKAVAVLYADSAGQDADAVNLEALETLVRVAGMSVELLAARRASHAEGSAAQASPPASAQSPAEQPRVAEEEEAPQTQEPRPAESEPQPAAAQAAHEPSQQPEPAPKTEPAQTTSPEPSHAPSSEPAREASTSFGKPSTAFERAPEPSFAPTPAPSSPTFAPSAETSPTPVSPLGTARRYGTMDMDFPVEVSEEEKRFHNEARRFARLLVSEIKLYNEQKVRDGRDHSDLYERLREDIDRSRQMYDKRVRPEVSNRFDYFHHELVNMLAEGDPEKLGADYPGATVNA